MQHSELSTQMAASDGISHSLISEKKKENNVVILPTRWKKFYSSENLIAGASGCTTTRPKFPAENFKSHFIFVHIFFYTIFYCLYILTQKDTGLFWKLITFDSVNYFFSFSYLESEHFGVWRCENIGAELNDYLVLQSLQA